MGRPNEGGSVENHNGACACVCLSSFIAVLTTPPLFVFEG